MKLLFSVPACAVIVLLASGCLYSPPDQLPSSVRILYSKHVVDSLGESTDIWFVVAREGNELRLTGDDGVDTQPVFAPGLRRVFFTRRPPGGRDEIWSMDLDGNDERRVVGAANADARDPAVAPDGRSLAFTLVRQGRPEAVVADIDGENPRPLIRGEGPSRQPVWSPDGRRLAVVAESGGRSRVVIVDVGSGAPGPGGAPRPLAPGDAETQSDPDWSPDGSRVAFTRGTGPDAEIAIADVATGTVTRITDNQVEDRDPAWSTTGQRIAFVSRRPSGKDNLWLVDPDGDDLVDLTGYEEDEARDPDWL